MGCGVFLQSDIVNQQRKGWQAEEILAALCSILPLNVWIYAGGMNNLAQVGKKYILQGGTHKNLAVVKTQVDFIRSKVPDAEVVVHPYSGEAGAIGAALVSLDWWEKGGQSKFRGFDVIEKSDLQDDHCQGHRMQLVPGDLPAQLHRRGIARRQGPRVEQGSAVKRLGARDRE